MPSRRRSRNLKERVAIRNVYAVQEKRALEIKDELNAMRQGLAIRGEFQATSQHSLSAHPNCSICFNLFEELANIAACACGHTFHYDCIVGWAKKCQTEGQPSLCPTCKMSFETKATCGVIKKLYFTFDSLSHPPGAIDKAGKRNLKEQIEIPETLLCEAESRNVEIAALRRKLELTEMLFKHYKSIKLPEMVELVEKLKLSQTMLMSVCEENASLKRKADILQEIVNLVTGARLTGDAAVPPIPSWVQVGNVNGGQKKKKNRPEVSESPVDTIVFLGSENEQVAFYSNMKEDDNFLMPALKLR